jgi:uncharacterized membrane protein YfcA
MPAILLFAAAGAFAQLVDGTLGMAFGVTSTTLLVLLGATPVSASAAVHFAEIGTTLASGLSHWREGNVDRKVLWRLGIPGSLGAFIGATVLSRISLADARVWMSALLLVLGLVLLLRFGLGATLIPVISSRPKTNLLVPLGSFAGFVDSTGGGGWGPITTPTLLTLTKTAPRRVVGTVSASEFMVAVSASTGFIFGAVTDVEWDVVAGLLIGGVMMAPIAAKLAGRLPSAPFGAAIGGAVILLNLRILLTEFGVATNVIWVVAISVVVATALLALRAYLRTDSNKS